MNWLTHDAARCNNAANNVLRRWQAPTLQRCKRIYDALHLRRSCPANPTPWHTRITDLHKS